MAINVRTWQLRSVHSEDGEHEANQPVFEEREMEQPFEETRRVRVAQEKTGENGERHDE